MTRTKSVALWSKQDWLDWERETGTVPDARCSGCGRGYHQPSREGVACLACGSSVFSVSKSALSPARATIEPAAPEKEKPSMFMCGGCPLWFYTSEARADHRVKEHGPFYVAQVIGGKETR